MKRNFEHSGEVDKTQITERLESITEILKTTQPTIDDIRRIMSVVDLTTLEGSDTKEKVMELCQKAKILMEMEGLPAVAAICIYPVFAGLVRKELEGTGIRTATVAGAFPSGQSPIHVKTAEVKYAVEEGAEEIDMVISRGAFLEKEYDQVFEEIAAIKKACGEAHLKVILETGELDDLTLIRRASFVAMHAGADFIKTSTGKIKPAATPESMMVMCDAIKNYKKGTGQNVGIKPAGGISDTATAMLYQKILVSTLGDDWNNNQLFRIGASRLVDALVVDYKKLT